MDFLKSKCCSNWKTTGTVVGVVAAAFTLILVALFGAMFLFVAKTKDILIVFSLLSKFE